MPCHTLITSNVNTLNVGVQMMDKLEEFRGNMKEGNGLNIQKSHFSFFNITEKRGALEKGKGLHFIVSFYRENPR